MLMGAGIVGGILLFPGLFAISSMPLPLFVMTLIWMAGAIPVFYGMCKLIGKLFNRFL